MTMAIASKLTTIGIIVLSLAMGFLFFYIFSDVTKEKKKKHIEELTSQLINFVIFIWIGKIVLNLSIFISDPLSILAYPSDSNAFYVAIVLMALSLLYKSIRNQIEVFPLIESFVHIFLMSSFIYEFIQFVIGDESNAFGYLILLAILIGIFFFLREHIPLTILLMILVTVWSIGIILLDLIQPFVTVFGYMMAPWFVGLFFILSIGSLTYKLRKGNT